MVVLCVDFKHLPAVISFGWTTADRHEVDHRAGFSPDERWFLSVVKQHKVPQGESFQECLPPLLRLILPHFTAQALKSPAMATGSDFLRRQRVDPASCYDGC